ncbi:hypothetical protein HYX08_04525 [Candidatus Woesearchaeota archaeon]|nr:hypothetical protein [Candidatus Woesearchaeota archaeon]
MSIKDMWKKLDYWKRGALIGIIYSIVTLGLVVILTAFMPLFVAWIVLLGFFTEPWSSLVLHLYSYLFNASLIEATEQVFGRYWHFYFLTITLLNMLVGVTIGFVIDKNKQKIKKILSSFIVIWVLLVFGIPITEYRFAKSDYEANRFPCNYFGKTEYEFEKISFRIFKQECKFEDQEVLFFFTMEAKNKAGNVIQWSPERTFFVDSKSIYKKYVWGQGFHKTDYSYLIEPENSVTVHLYTFFENQDGKSNLLIYQEGLI